MERKSDKFHQFVLRMPGFLEKIVAAILIIGVMVGCVRLVVDVLDFNLAYAQYAEILLTTAFNVIIIVEFIRMLVKHSMNTIVEVLIFAIARGLVADHADSITTLVSVVAIALLLACRKYLFKDFDFEEEV